ncbi:MAG: cytochrome b/b6 domain-containing protein [Archaeoglobales archaeon]|nr:MAG: cytochrome b/b6 domain-containing protein [Archaeoglobales archaeon]
MREVEVLRHSLFYRVCHWAIFSTFFILLITGMCIGRIFNLSSPDKSLFLDIHFYTGIVFGILWFIMLGYIIAKEWRFFSIKRIPYGLKFFIKELKAWFNLGPHVEDPRRYDPERKEYVEKIIPTEVLVWWGYFTLAMIMGITGISIYYNSFYMFFDGVARVLMVDDGYTLFRTIHKLGMFIFGAIVLTHFYAVIVFGVVKSMFTGRRLERVK